MSDTLLTGVGPGRARLGAVDTARGVAVLAMVAYHTAWDLGELRLIETDIARQPGWLLFARVIAASFLTLVGVGLVLGHGDRVRTRPFLRRLAVLVVAALAVTVATALAFPDSFIFFGILHNIALSSLLGLPLVAAPALLPAGLAVLTWSAPAFLDAPLFDTPLLAFLGLGSRVPITNDYVPVFPWTGFVFAGIACARIMGPKLRSGPRLAGGPGRALAWLGRHSLALYLLHQPVLFGLLWGLVQVTGPNPVAEAAPFRRACLASCAARAGPAQTCQSGCDCAVAALRREGLWGVATRGRPSETEASRAAAVTRPCFTPSG